MKRLLCLLAMGAACLFLLLPSASATLLTFEDLTTDAWTISAGTTYTESGYTFATTELGDFYSFGSSALPEYWGGWTGSAALVEGYSEGFTLSATNDSLFSLVSLEVSEILGDGSYSVSFTVQGTLADGSSVSQDVTTDGIFGLETILFGEDFSALASVSFSMDSSVQDNLFQIDNLTVNTAASEVPLPLPLVLLCSGLLVTGATRKRQS